VFSDAGAKATIPPRFAKWGHSTDQTMTSLDIARARVKNGAPYMAGELWSVFRPAANDPAYDTSRDDDAAIEATMASVFGGREWRLRLQATDPDFQPRTLAELTAHLHLAQDDWKRYAMMFEHAPDDTPEGVREIIQYHRDKAQGRARDYSAALKRLAA
jgi:hypothetical protein